MSAKTSRFTPQAPTWNRDLPERDQPQNQAPSLYDKLNFIDEHCLEIGRPPAKLRGIMLVIALVVSVTSLPSVISP